MKKIDTLLFDFDGVVADTEGQYTDFWSGAAKKYGASGGADFSLKIKGTLIYLKRFEEGLTGLNWA